MENATKALLIAASVLVAILLIAMMMGVLNTAKPTMEQSEAAMNVTAIASFNNQFSGYIGDNIKGNKVSTLKQKVIASNAVNPDKTISGSILTGTINQNKYYKVEVPVTGGYVEGYIRIINITEK